MWVPPPAPVWYKLWNKDDKGMHLLQLLRVGYLPVVRNALKVCLELFDEGVSSNASCPDTSSKGYLLHFIEVIDNFKTVGPNCPDFCVEYELDARPLKQCSSIFRYSPVHQKRIYGNTYDQRTFSRFSQDCTDVPFVFRFPTFIFTDAPCQCSPCPQ